MWHQFAKQESLSGEQVEQFKEYLALLLAWNKKSNLTTITDPQKVIDYHFHDSLVVKRIVDMETIRSIADVGSGAGFPGVPLAIMYPDIELVLIEVNQKKVRFLRELITRLELDNVVIVDYDWRTFLRKTEYDLQLVCARASLQPKELLRMFQASCKYHDASLVYWASESWEPDKEARKHIVRDLAYKVGTRRRRLILFKKLPPSTV